MIDSALQTDALMYITDRPAVSMVRGEGAWLWDNTGQRYLDFVQGWAVNCLGHSPRVVVEAIQQQAATLINPSPAYFNTPMCELAQLLVDGCDLDKVFFTNCGAEANEGAIKLARKWGQLHKDGAYEIITMDHAFHGRTLATMSASGKPQWAELYEPKVSGFPKVELNDLDAVRRAITPKTVGILLEPIQGEAGVIPADDAYLQGLRALADEAGILLIVDEVQTGIGRTGKLFAHQWAGITPDIMTLGKGIGGGVPLAALVARDAVCCFQPGDQGGTYNGNPLVTAAGCAVLRTVTAPGFLDNVNRMSAYLTAQLDALSARFALGSVRGRGLLLALEIPQENAAEITKRAFAHGLLINAPRPNTLRFMPALNLTAAEVDAMITLLGDVLAFPGRSAPWDTQRRRTVPDILAQHEG
ncbi:MAG TPA: acetylornithine transaminase [Armatimonadota bacterium]|jgi:acetylornithine/N-succinyldiaminopimelate aminotransferase